MTEPFLKWLTISTGSRISSGMSHRPGEILANVCLVVKVGDRGRGLPRGDAETREPRRFRPCLGCFPVVSLRRRNPERMPMGPRISVVVPMYNEEANAENAVRSLLAVMPSIAVEFEILVIESGSTDRTAEIADDLANVDPRVRVIHQINREGLGSAIRLGFANSRM